MRSPSNKEIREALQRAAQEVDKATLDRLIDVAWQILSWEFPNIDEHKIREQASKR